MSLPVAERLNAALSGRYRLERELGQGGMATVFLADDLRHDRKVALKVLRPELAAVIGAGRFLAEIKTTANLRHPHILPLFDSGEADGFLFYVMPFAEGETLRERLDRDKQLPVTEAVAITVAVAQALQHAHDRGVIHRDIKPGNILLQDGQAVVADFGIALAVGAAGGQRMTETGLSVGTPFYMSPEQATGDQHVGPASDIYSLAAVLYESLIGDPPYIGSTAQAVLGKIIQGAPVSATAARRAVPANVDAAIRKALEKLAADRFASAQDFAKALSDPSFTHGGEGPLVRAADGRWRRVAMASIAAAIVLGFALAWSLARPGTEQPLATFSAPFQADQLPTNQFSFTADGSAVVYVGRAETGTGTQLWIRRWSDLRAEPIPGTTGAITFALSPDEREVAFAPLGGTLSAVPLNGGPGRTLNEGIVGSVGAWSFDGYVYFGGASGIARVNAALGASPTEVLTQLSDGETIHSSIRLLPGERFAVFQVWHAQDATDAEVWALDLDSRQRRFLIAGSSPRYSPSGHLLFGSTDGVVFAAPIDEGRAELTAAAAPVLTGLVVRPPYGAIDYDASADGSLLYRRGGLSATEAELVWMTRAGDATPVDPGWRVEVGVSVGYSWSLSPRGDRIVVANAPGELWVKQLPDGPVDRLTSDLPDGRFPTWSPDGESITFVAGTSGDYNLWQRRADGTGRPELLLDDQLTLNFPRWSPDGSRLVLSNMDLGVPPGAVGVLGFRPGDTAAVPLVATPEFYETAPELSPDGRWLAYISDEAGRQEVYVRPFPEVESGRYRVSTDGGTIAVWSHGGRELFYMAPDRTLIAAEVEPSMSSFTVRQRRALFTVGEEFLLEYDAFDVTSDDQRFLMARRVASAETPEFVLVQNYFQELRRLAPN